MKFLQIGTEQKSTSVDGEFSKGLFTGIGLALAGLFAVASVATRQGRKRLPEDLPVHRERNGHDRFMERSN